MSLNWMTVIAQICNFLILIWLLKRFLYGPILRAMDVRQEHLVELEDTARRKSAEAEGTVEAYTALMADLEKEKHRILNDAKSAAERDRQAFIEQARREVESIKHDWVRSLNQEQSAFLQQARVLIGQGGCQLARRVLQDLAGAELDQAMLAVFMEKLLALSPDQQQQLRAGGELESEPIRIHSSFALNADQQKRITAMLLPLVGTTRTLDFVVWESLIAGIELDVGDQHFGWSVEEYLHDFEQMLQRYMAKGIPPSEQEHA